MAIFLHQVAVVTGATRGIGKAVTLALLQQGATVAGIYHSNHQAVEQLRQESGGTEKLHLFQCDVADEAQVNSFFADVEQRFSAIDILVNCAGIRRDAILAMMKSDDWREVIDTNLTGSFLMAKQAVLLMMKKKYGRIINITSPVSHLGFAGQANYAASKAGQIGMTRSLAKETAKKRLPSTASPPALSRPTSFRTCRKSNSMATGPWSRCAASAQPPRLPMPFSFSPAGTPAI